MINADSKVVPLFPNKPYAKDLFRYRGMDGDIEIHGELTIEDIQEQAQLNQISVTLCNILSTAIEQCGFDHPNADVSTNQDFCLVMEALISLVKRYNDKEHPLHEIAENCIVVDNDDPDGYTYEFRAPEFTTEDE